MYRGHENASEIYPTALQTIYKSDTITNTNILTQPEIQVRIHRRNVTLFHGTTSSRFRLYSSGTRGIVGRIADEFAGKSDAIRGLIIIV